MSRGPPRPSQNNELSTTLLFIGNSSARKFQNFHFLQNSKWDKIKRILKQGEGDDDDHRGQMVLRTNDVGDGKRKILQIWSLHWILLLRVMMMKIIFDDC